MGAEAATSHERDGATKAVCENAAYGAGDEGPEAVTRLAGADSGALPAVSWIQTR